MEGNILDEDQVGCFSAGGMDVDMQSRLVKFDVVKSSTKLIASLDSVIDGLEVLCDG